jgi:hypothetical protein
MEANSTSVETSGKKRKVHYYTDSDSDVIEVEEELNAEYSSEEGDDGPDRGKALESTKKIAVARQSVVTTSTTTSRSSKSKVVVLEEFWTPSEAPQHCREGKEYLARNGKGRRIFDEYMALTESKGTNFVSRCACCGYGRNASAAKLLNHFLQRKCSLENVPEVERIGMEDHLVSLAQARDGVYNRSASGAVGAAKREPSEDQKESRQGMAKWCNDAKQRQEYVRQRVAKMLVACNLPASLGESPFFRDFVTDVTGGKVSDDDTENALGRKLVTEEMDRFADVKSKTSLEAWTKQAKTYGGTLLVDGWTAARLIGTIGVSLCCLAACHVLPLILSGIERSRATDYSSKLESVVPWDLMYFTCTDGASNMIAFGRLLQEDKFILPNLCSAHGFSLTVHYIGKVFEKRSNMFSKVAGIIAFFNRSTQRLAKLKHEAGSAIGLIKFCKTRMAYQTLALLRVIRLRRAAQKALITLKDEKGNDDNETIDTFSKIAQVDSSLNDDLLFRDIEIFCRATLPVLLAMREVDRGTPMAGFVYWLHYHVESQVDQIMEKLATADGTFKPLRREITSAIRFVWDKRHRPVLTVAYLTNPLFQKDLSAEDNVFDLDENFASDVETVFLCMTRKRYWNIEVADNGDAVDEEFIHREAATATAQLLRYLKPGALLDQNHVQAKVMLAAEFWRTSARMLSEFPTLARHARKLHSMSVVTSKLERFFSRVGNVQTERRASLLPERAAKYAAASEQLALERSSSSEGEMQKRLVLLVQECEKIQMEEKVFEYTNTPGFDALDSWVTRVATAKAETLYAPDDAEVRAGTSTVVELEPMQQSLLEELDESFEERDQVRKGTRARQPKRKFALIGA